MPKMFLNCVRTWCALIFFTSMAHGQVVINEFMAANSSHAPNVAYDAFGNASDWIELYNASDSAVDLTGWALTDKAKSPAKWPFPPTTLGARDYLLVFATGRDVVEAGELHTNFKLGADGGFLGLANPAGTIVSSFAYPTQYLNASYGLNPQDTASSGYFAMPTPKATNAVCGSGFGPEVEFSQTSGTFQQKFTLALSVPNPDFEIRYEIVTDNIGVAMPAFTNVPTAKSSLYTGPLTVSSTRQVRARAFAKQGTAFPGPSRTESYVKISATAAAFTSDLPILLMHSLGARQLFRNVRQNTILMVFMPTNGFASMTNPPATATRSGLHTRGRITADSPHYPLSVEFWNEYNDDRKLEFAGLPAESDWVLYPPDDMDNSLIRNPFLHQLSREIGRYSPRTQFVECFYNTNGGTVSFTGTAGGDYFGMYTIEEKIKIGANRVALNELSPRDTNATNVTGGYLLKIDSYAYDDCKFYDPYAAMNIVFVSPKSPEIKSDDRKPQFRYLTNYFNEFGSVLWGSNYTDPATGYAAYIDVDSWIDHHLLESYAQNVDAFRLSGYFFKGRSGKIEMGPLWDLHLTMMGDANQWSGSWGTDYFSTTSGSEQGVRWWGRLFSDIDFWQKWVDRWTLLRQDILTPEHLNAMIDRYRDQLSQAAPRQDKRWGVGSYYQSSIVSLKEWSTDRLAFLDTYTLKAPQFNLPAGSQVPLGTVLQLSNNRAPGSTIYYTLDGTDPRLPGGGVAPGALSSTGPVDLVVKRDLHVFARNYDATHKNPTGTKKPPVSTPWSGPLKGAFTLTVAPVRITQCVVAGGNVTLGFIGRTGFVYDVQKACSLQPDATWIPIQTRLPGTDTAQTVTDPAGPAAAYYRIITHESQ